MKRITRSIVRSVAQSIVRFPQCDDFVWISGRGLKCNNDIKSVLASNHQHDSLALTGFKNICQKQPIEPNVFVRHLLVMGADKKFVHNWISPLIFPNLQSLRLTSVLLSEHWTDQPFQHPIFLDTVTYDYCKYNRMDSGMLPDGYHLMPEHQIIAFRIHESMLAKFAP